jgi:hypothetical protein
MIGKLVFLWPTSALITLVCSGLILAQTVDTTAKNDPSQRIRIAPESVFTLFREAGMKPVNHELTPAQKEKVSQAFARLPPLHQRLLTRHLQSISFLDNMPNTALTSLLNSGDGLKRFNSTFRAGLLDETISEWASWEENTCFKRTTDSRYAVRVEGGKLDAILYVLLHEATHVVDAVMNITPQASERRALVKPTPFTKDVWRTMNVPDDKYLDSLLDQTRFRSGQPMPIRLAPDVYRKLTQTPFPYTAWRPGRRTSPSW